ncbi:hypothetical protein TrRE_jg11547, partial [Triparma retinervis]
SSTTATTTRGRLR